MKEKEKEKTTKKKEETKKTKSIKSTKEVKVKKVKNEKTDKIKKVTKPKKTIEEKKEEVKKEVSPIVKEVVKEKSVKKETKKDSSEVLFDSKSQHRLKSLSKVVRILIKISKIFLMIVVPFIFIAMIAVPFIFKNLEINGNVIKFSDASIVINEDYVTFKAGDKIYISNEDFRELSSIANFFANNTKGDIVLLTEVSLGFVAATLIITIYILTYLEKLFKNIELNITPFTSENTNYIYRVGHLMIISAIVSLVFELTIGLMFPKINVIKLSSYGIIEILIIFIIYFVFKYATELQNKSDYRIYK